MEPACGLRKPIRMRKATDLPTPLRPRMQSVSPRLTLKLTLSRIFRSPNHMETLANEMRGTAASSAVCSLRPGSLAEDSAIKLAISGSEESDNSGLGRESDVAIRSAYAMNARRVNFCKAQILVCIDVEEPPQRGQRTRMGNLAALNQRFNRQHGYRFSHTGCGSLECGVTATTAGLQFFFEYRQRRAAHHRWKGLCKPIDGRHRDGLSCNPGVLKQTTHQRSRQQWKIDGKKNRPARGG